MTSKYDPLRTFLTSLQENEWGATFFDVEKVLGFRLPASARNYPAWWANERRGSHTHSKAWLGAGWLTSDVDLNGERLVFRRCGSPARPRRRGYSRWSEAGPSGSDRAVDTKSEQELSLCFAWQELGRALLDGGGRITFPRVPAEPAVYRFHVQRQSDDAVYVGQAEDFSRRLQHYRTPGPTQRTNQRINKVMAGALKAGGSVTVAKLSTSTRLTINGGERAANLEEKVDRVLLEHAALVVMANETGKILNL